MVVNVADVKKTLYLFAGRRDSKMSNGKVHWGQVAGLSEGVFYRESDDIYVPVDGYELVWELSEKISKVYDEKTAFDPIEKYGKKYDVENPFELRDILAVEFGYIDENVLK